MIRSVRVAVRAVAASAVLAVVAGCAAPSVKLPLEPGPSVNVHGYYRPISCPMVSAAYTTSASSPGDPGATPMNSPQAEALAQALGTQGRGGYADVFGLLVVDNPLGRVTLCVTDTARGRQLAAAAKRADPGIDLSRLDIFACPYSERQLDAAMRRMSQRTGATFDGFPIYSISPAGANAGIEVTTSQQGAVSASLQLELTALGGGIPVSEASGSPVTSAQLSVPATKSDG
ncbi:hypothetical protein [Streptacidiphilus sp. P02-A3a]|uniref:hypothetical protein n=1 Tax=Streptacidiphilus sp. P02-A3a TaxID=2704468 RepID=UPI0015FC9E15|nr:hypothetical protein [Streptacidiphilus sp. P02-A3a]QMU70978.1 hypothetical protein GXP74_24905 [Streptacidiphilus sp. P02-A3a]